MEVAAILFVLVVTVYLACVRPPWYWAAAIAGPALLQCLGRVMGIDIGGGIQVGPILMRDTDPALLAVIIGLYYNHRHREFEWRKKEPISLILQMLFVFLALKIVVSILFYRDQIMQNRSVSHVAGGLVAALGDLRDSLLPLFPPFYAYAIRKSRNINALTAPLLVCVGVIVLKGLLSIALTGQIWTGTGETENRYINADDAITLTILGFILAFARSQRLSVFWTRVAAAFAVLFALVANHRSQWIGTVMGFVVLLIALLFGRPILQKGKLVRLAVAAGLLAAATAGLLLADPGQLAQKYPLIGSLSVRLYAITDPQRDPTAEWREEIWKDRIAEVGGDWPWGRPLGDRHEVLFHGTWINLPDHSMYVTLYEVGGVILCILMLLFWARIVQSSIVTLLRERLPERLWPAAVALAIVASSLAYGSAYLFPFLGPSFALIMAMGDRLPERSTATRRRLRLPARTDALPSAVHV